MVNPSFMLNEIQWTLSISNSQGTNEFVRDRERKLGWNQWKGTEKIDRDREKFEIERVHYTLIATAIFKLRFMLNTKRPTERNIYFASWQYVTPIK